MKNKNKKWEHYFICKGEPKGESNCGKVFFNDDDNVCAYCGSKNTKRVLLEIEMLPL